MSGSQKSESDTGVFRRFVTSQTNEDIEKGLNFENENSTPKSQVSSLTDLKSLFSGVERKSLRPKIEPEKRMETLENLRVGTISGGDREPLVCPIEILFIKNLDEFVVGPETGRVFLSIMREVSREAPEFRLRFSQGESIFMDFFYSELVSAKTLSLCIIEFEFTDHNDNDGENKILRIKFRSEKQFERLEKEFRRYFMLLKESNKAYEPQISDYMKNLGGQVNGFWKKTVLEWDERDIVEWLKMIPFQRINGSDITTVFEFLKEEKVFPRKFGKRSKRKKKEVEKLTQNTAEGADFMCFHYDKLVRFFEERRREGPREVVKKRNEEEEIEGEGEEEDPFFLRYLKKLLKGKRWKKLRVTFSFELTLMKENTNLDGLPYFNYNYHQVLKKLYEDMGKGGKTGVKLFSLQQLLHVFGRKMWSVTDCVDHILSLYFFNMGTEEWIQSKEIELEGGFFGPSEQVARRSEVAWEEWEKKLNRLNEQNSILLEKLSFNVWISHRRRCFFKERKRVSQELNKIRKESRRIRNTAELSAEEKKRQTESLRQKMKPLRREYDMIPKKEKRFVERMESRFEENRFLLSRKRRTYIQKLLVDRLIVKMERGMFDFGVKTVLSLSPASREEEFEEMFMGNVSKIGLKLTKFFGKKPSFAKFGFCHSSVMFANIAIHWFSNSLILVDHLREKGNPHEEIIAMEAGCPTLVYGNIKSAYEQILQLAEFIIKANVEYEYTLMGDLKEGEKSKKLNCQRVTRRLLKLLKYTKYDPEIKEYIDQFVDKYSKIGGLTKPKDTKNSRWLPLSDENFRKRFRGPLLIFEKKYNSKNAVELPDQLFFNSRHEVCELTLELLNLDKLFAANFPGVYQLLKSFDRAFQILGHPVSKCPFTILGV